MTACNFKSLNALLRRLEGAHEHVEDGGISELRTALYNFEHATDDYSDWDGEVLSYPAITDHIRSEAAYLAEACDDADAVERDDGAAGYEVALRIDTCSAALARAVLAAIG